MPSRKKRCVKKNTTTSGSVASVAAAIIGAHSVVRCDLKVNKPSDKGYWLALGQIDQWAKEIVPGVQERKNRHDHQRRAR